MSEPIRPGARHIGDGHLAGAWIHVLAAMHRGELLVEPLLSISTTLEALLLLTPTGVSPAGKPASVANVPNNPSHADPPTALLPTLARDASRSAGAFPASSQAAPHAELATGRSWPPARPGSRRHPGSARGDRRTRRKAQTPRRRLALRVARLPARRVGLFVLGFGSSSTEATPARPACHLAARISAIEAIAQLARWHRRGTRQQKATVHEHHRRVVYQTVSPEATVAESAAPRRMPDPPIPLDL